MPRIEGKLRIENRIYDLRSEKSVTQQELAEAVDVTRATIIALEKGSYNPSLELAIRISKYFKVKIDHVFFEKGGST